MTPDETIDKCKFGFFEPVYRQTILVDDDTNDVLNEELYVYYIAVLNRLFSKSTTRDWLNSEYTKRYDEDIPYEKKHYNCYAKILGL